MLGITIPKTRHVPPSVANGEGLEWVSLVGRTILHVLLVLAGVAEDSYLGSLGNTRPSGAADLSASLGDAGGGLAVAAGAAAAGGGGRLGAALVPAELVAHLAVHLLGDALVLEASLGSSARPLRDRPGYQCWCSNVCMYPMYVCVCGWVGGWVGACA